MANPDCARESSPAGHALEPHEVASELPERPNAGVVRAPHRAWSADYEDTIVPPPALLPAPLAKMDRGSSLFVGHQQVDERSAIVARRMEHEHGSKAAPPSARVSGRAAVGASISIREAASSVVGAGSQTATQPQPQPQLGRTPTATAIRV